MAATTPIHSPPQPKTLTLTHHSLPRLLKLASASSSATSGGQLHAAAVKLGLAAFPSVSTSLLSFYSCAPHHHHLALKLFDEMPRPNKTLVAFTAAMSSCLRSHLPRLALRLFVEMIDSSIYPDSFAFVAFLAACAGAGALGAGRAAHGMCLKAGMPLTSFLATALVDMYCKCSAVEDAVAVFSFAPGNARCVQFWNAMIHGLAVHGRGAEALQLFETMVASGSVWPNGVTLVGVLCACVHAGLVPEGKLYFGSMKAEYGIEPSVKHYGCMVDLLGRAGFLDEAFEMATSMPVPSNHIVWGALLRACSVHGDIAVAGRVMERIKASGSNMVGDTSHYVIMSNMYREAEMSDDMVMVRAKVGKKPKGQSWIEVGGRMHEFGVGLSGCAADMWMGMDAMLMELDMKVGNGRSKGDHHSEKVAVAFGLLKTRAPMPIRIFKNLRICKDCHNLMKLVSKDYKREIVVRDCTRFHRFMGGICSCRDYW